MKWYRGPEGDQRLWFEPDEIEAIVTGLVPVRLPPPVATANIRLTPATGLPN